VEDAQPHSMPIPVTLSSIPRGMRKNILFVLEKHYYHCFIIELARNDETNRPRVIARASTNVMQDGSSLELIGQFIIRESTMTIAPTEHPRKLINRNLET